MYILMVHLSSVFLSDIFFTETMFTVMNNGDILKVKTNRNPCQIMSEWKCPDPAKGNVIIIMHYENTPIQIY